MNTRSAPPELPADLPKDPPPATPMRLAPWVVVALAVTAGVILAFRYGPRITPLIDGVR